MIPVPDWSCNQAHTVLILPEGPSFHAVSLALSMVLSQNTEPMLPLGKSSGPARVPVHTVAHVSRPYSVLSCHGCISRKMHSHIPCFLPASHNLLLSGFPVHKAHMWHDFVHPAWSHPGLSGPSSPQQLWTCLPLGRQPDFPVLPLPRRHTPEHWWCRQRHRRNPPGFFRLCLDCFVFVFP